MSKAFERLSTYLIHKRQMVLWIWLILLVSSGLILKLNPNQSVETQLTGATGTEAWQVREILTHDFNKRLGSSAAIVMPAHQDASALRQFLKQEFKQIASIEAVQTDTAHRLQILNLEYKPEYPLTDMQDLTKEIRTALRTWQQKQPPQTVLPLVTGNTALQYDTKIESSKDSHRSEVLALLISLVILVFNFGSLSAALIPLMMGASSIIMLNAIIKVFALSVNPVSRILTSLVGLALGIDYALFMVSRFREELPDQEWPEALRRSLNQSGHTIFYSGLIMLCSISALLLPEVTLSRTVMLHLLMVISLSMLHALVILPAVLAWKPQWLTWPKWLAQRIVKQDTYPFWHRFSTHVVDHAKMYFVLSMVFLLALAWPVTGMRLWDPVQAIAPKGSESKQAYDQLLADQWGGELLPVIVAVKHPQGQVYDPGFIEFLHSFNQALKQHPSVYRVQSLVSGTQDLQSYQSLYQQVQTLGILGSETALAPLVNIQTGSNTTLVYIFPKKVLQPEDTRQVIDFVRQYAKEHSKYPILTGGIVARVQDFTFELYRYTPWIVLLIMLSVYALLWWHMKTLILPIKAAVMNFVPILASFGLLTLIFQHGLFHQILQTPVNGAVTNTVPIVMFCLVFGLSMDYEVLILSRVTEEYRRHGNVRQAVIEGLARSGSVITGAVLILLGVFLPGCFSTAPQTREICFGITIAILLDATVVRLFLVPSFMMLMGRWNWWQPQQKKH